MDFNNNICIQWISAATLVGGVVTLPIAYTGIYVAMDTPVSYTGQGGMGADITCVTRTLTTVKLGNNNGYQGIRFNCLTCGF